jgi:hypothetical protein
MADNTVNMFDWSSGIVNAKINPLNYPITALLQGENIDIINQYLVTRKGSETVTASTFTGGIVEYLTQVKLPTSEVSYMLAQVRTSTACKLYASPSTIPQSDLTFTEIFDLGTTAGKVSVATLNDRVVITEGTAQLPLVWAGCMDSTGGDWATPKQILAYDGTTYYDHSIYLCDTDIASSLDLPDIKNLVLYICLDMKSVSGLYFGVATANTETGTMVVSYWSGVAWTPISITDGTATAGVPLAKSGVVTWTAVSSEYKTISLIPGFWLRITFSAISTSPTIPPRLSSLKFKAPCQALQSIEDSGQTVFPMYCGKYITTTATDYALEVACNTTDVYMAIGGLTSSNHWYVGHPTPFNALDVTMIAGKVNAVTSTLTAQYWNGATWTALTILDGTASSGKTLAQTGTIEWAVPSTWKEYRPTFEPELLAYWVRFISSGTLTADTRIDQVQVSTVPVPLSKHTYVVPYWDRIVLADQPSAHDSMIVSGPMEEYKFSGSNAIAIRAGGLGRIISCNENYDQTWVSKAHDWFILDNDTWKNLELRRVEAANQTPINNQVAIRAPLDRASRSQLESSELLALDRKAVYFLNYSGAWCFTGEKIFNISTRLTWWDESSSNPRLDLDYLHLATGTLWLPKNWLVWSVPMVLTTATSQATCNRLIIYDVEVGKWLPPFSISAASLSSADLYTANVPGNVGQQALYAGTYAGEVMRLFESSVEDDDGLDITAYFTTGWHHFGSPEAEKLLRFLYVYGSTDATSITLSVYRDGNEVVETGNSFTITDLASATGRLFDISFKHRNINARFFKLKMEFTGPTQIYGMQLVLAPERTVPATVPEV